MAKPSTQARSAANVRRSPVEVRDGHRFLTMVRFRADADLNQVIVTALVRRSPMIDFRSSDRLV